MIDIPTRSVYSAVGIRGRCRSIMMLGYPHETMDQPQLPRIIHTSRLMLRPHRLSDADAVLAFATDPEWARFLPVAQPYEPRHAEEFLARQILLDWSTHPSWAIELEDVVVGGINLRLDHINRVGEFGYSVARSLWGQGVTTEAATAVVQQAFHSLPELNRVRAMADLRNVASQRVMEKIGMRREGVLRQNRRVRGEAIDEAWYGVLRQELEGSTHGTAS
jgi:ribosomal-protein-alanine N-acetyltransferase